MTQPVTTKLFVGNVPRGSDTAELEAEFAHFGTVAECDILSDFAFIHFADPDEANAALRGMNGKVFNGKVLKVEKSTSYVRQKPGAAGVDATVCYVCNETGHWAKNCPQVPESEREKQFKRSSERVRRGGAAPGPCDWGDDDYEDYPPPPPRRRPPPPGYYDDYDDYYHSRRRPAARYYDPYDYDYPPPRRLPPPPSYYRDEYDYPPPRRDEYDYPPLRRDEYDYPPRRRDEYDYPPLRRDEYDYARRGPPLRPRDPLAEYERRQVVEYARAPPFGAEYERAPAPGALRERPPAAAVEYARAPNTAAEYARAAAGSAAYVDYAADAPGKETAIQQPLDPLATGAAAVASIPTTRSPVDYYHRIAPTAARPGPY